MSTLVTSDRSHSSTASLHVRPGQPPPAANTPPFAYTPHLSHLPHTSHLIRPPLPDRDMDVLRREVAAVLGRHLAPGEWELTEHIDSEAAWAGGKRLFILYLT